MTPTGAKLLNHLDAMRCVSCSERLELDESGLHCLGCGHQFPITDGVPFLLDSDDRASQELAGHMEALFRFPAFYWLKINLLLKLNKTTDLELRDYLRRKTVLDVGCGPFSYGYDTALPDNIVGIDLSHQFVRAMNERNPKNLCLVANAKKIPFAKKSFDVSFLRYVIHHIPGDTSQLLAEVARTTREYLIIFDHVRSDVPWQQTVQTAYWKSFDSGHHYNTMAEWDQLLRPYKVAMFHRTGRMFGNVCQIILDLRGRD